MIEVRVPDRGPLSAQHGLVFQWEATRLVVWGWAEQADAAHRALLDLMLARASLGCAGLPLSASSPQVRAGTTDWISGSARGTKNHRLRRAGDIASVEFRPICVRGASIGFASG